MGIQVNCKRVLMAFCLGFPVVALPTCALSVSVFRPIPFSVCIPGFLIRRTWVWALTALLMSLHPGSRRCSGLHRQQSEAEVLEQSAQTLRAHLGALLSALCRSVRACPAVVRATFRQLFKRVRERFPDTQHEVRSLPGRSGGGEGKGSPIRVGAGVIQKGVERGLAGAHAWRIPARFRSPPECAVHRCHQLPVPALLLSRHHVAQALPPARAPRRRPHQPHSAPAGQGAGLQTWVGRLFIGA